MGLVGNMDIIDNMMLTVLEKGKVFSQKKQPEQLAEKLLIN